MCTNSLEKVKNLDMNIMLTKEYRIPMPFITAEVKIQARVSP